MRAKDVLATLQATEADVLLYARLAGCVIYANAALRAAPDVLASNLQGQQSLWAYGISGDLPIVLLRIADPGHIDLVRELVQAHAHWRLNGLAAEVVDLDALKAAGLVRNDIERVKIILSGAVTRAVTVRGLGVTKGARAAIEAAGGRVED